MTASHNPKDYTGMKIVRRGAPVGGDSGLMQVRDGAAAGFGPVASRGGNPHRGRLARLRREGPLVRRRGRDPAAARRRRRRERDGGQRDAASGLRAPQLDVVRCYFKPSRSFPNHEPNPLLPENREFIVTKTREEGADLGVAA